MKLSEILNENEKDEFYRALRGNQKIITAYTEGPMRDLNIIGRPVSAAEWQKTMEHALSDSGGQYNDFDAHRVGESFKQYMYEMDLQENELRFIPGREGSVVLYITATNATDLEELADELESHGSSFSNPDEVNLYPNGQRGIPGPVLRVWWD